MFLVVFQMGIEIFPKRFRLGRAEEERSRQQKRFQTRAYYFLPRGAARHECI